MTRKRRDPLADANKTIRDIRNQLHEHQQTVIDPILARLMLLEEHNTERIRDLSHLSDRLDDVDRLLKLEPILARLKCLDEQSADRLDRLEDLECDETLYKSLAQRVDAIEHAMIRSTFAPSGNTVVVGNETGQHPESASQIRLAIRHVSDVTRSLGKVIDSLCEIAGGLDGIASQRGDK